MAEKNPVHVDPISWARICLPADEYQALLTSLSQPLDLSIRINILKADPKEAIAKWSALYGWKTEPVPFCPSGFWIRSYESPPSATIEHRLGYFYIQEAASMLPPELFDFSGIEQPFVLDMAASPGGKTTHLASLTSDTGLVIANDGSRSRIPALQVVLGKWGAASQAVTCLPGEAFGTLYPDTFDAVLLDAPCSMQGLRSAESHASRAITLSEIESLAARQLRLLESALRAAKPGGQVVYSTCTLSPQENELVLAVLMQHFPTHFRIEDVSSHLPVPAPALTKIPGENVPDLVRRALRLWPHLLGTAGFFTARLTKLERLPESAASNWRLPPVGLDFKPVPRKNIQKLASFLKDHNGFSLEELLEKSTLEVVTHKEQYYLISKILNELFKNLPILSAGLPLGKPLKDKVLISHEFVSRFGDKFTTGILTLQDEWVSSWVRGEDIRGYRSKGLPLSEIYAIRDRHGKNLGRGKLLADRLKNMLPTRLF
jgi:16S rRNA (cytosine1407-C5)-methyltransferase